MTCSPAACLSLLLLSLLEISNKKGKQRASVFSLASVSSLKHTGVGHKHMTDVHCSIGMSCGDQGGISALHAALLGQKGVICSAGLELTSVLGHVEAFFFLKLSPPD